MTRRCLVLAALAAATVAACADPDVTSELSRRSDGTSPPSTATPDRPPPDSSVPDPTLPPSTPPEQTSPPSTTPPTSSAPSPTTEQPPDEAVDDPLYPDIGSNDLDVQSYDVRLNYDPATLLVEADVTIVGVAARPLDQLVLDADELTVVGVEVDGAAATFAMGGGDLVIDAPVTVAADASTVVDVRYTDVASTSPRSQFGFDTGWVVTAGGSYVLNEPDAGHTWLPSDDHPSDKATWRFEITVPAGTTAVANGELVEQRSGAEGETWVWEQREPMATYLVQLLIGDYAILDGGTIGTIPIVNVALRSDVERMAPYFELTAEQLAFFEPLFGPYPLDRYGLAFADSIPGLALETQGRSLFSRDDFPGGLPGAVEHLFLSHELAHQWFGNAVTPARWSDLWLNESFATYGEWLWLDHAGLVPLDAQTGTNLQFRQNFTEPTGTPTAANLFGFERYNGGAVVVHALRLTLGDDAFFTLLQRWVADNDGTSRTTEDFIALAEEVAGSDLDEFFDTWLFAGDIPDQYPS